MHECNNCDRHCRINLDKLSREEMLSDCSYHLTPSIFKLPILLHLMTDDRKLNLTKELLEINNIEIKEKERYPYFILKDKRRKR